MKFLFLISIYTVACSIIQKPTVLLTESRSKTRSRITSKEKAREELKTKIKSALDI